MDDLPSIELPIEGVLDLHTFRPSQVKDLVATYLDACRLRGLRRLRIIHGKGTGALCQTVHALLRQRPDVADFYLAGATSGEWGATWVELRPDPKPTPHDNL